MSEIDKDLQRWYALQAELATVKEQEMTLRKKIFAHFFPTPNEGTNTVPLGANWKIVAKYPITRIVEKDKPIMLPLNLMGAESSFGHSMLYQNFPYLPTAAA